MSENKSRWGSLLSGAVAGLESRLDTILADDEQASARARAAEEAGKAKAAKEKILKAEQQDSSRASSKNRANDRLQARLAKAVGKVGDTSRPVSRQSSEVPSPRSQSPSLEVRDMPRSSQDSHAEGRQSSTMDTSRDLQANEGAHDEDELSANDAQKSGSVRASQDSIRHSSDAVQPPEPPAAPHRRASFLESELSRVNLEHTTEVHEHLERIDALHAKIAYLSSQLHSNATAATSSTVKGSQDQKKAEQDAKIAQLLQEGEKLSRNEMKHLTAIKKLRLRIQEEERSSADVKKRVEKLEAENRDLKDRAEISEEREKAAAERLSKLAKVEKEAESLRSDKESALREVQELKRSRDEAERRAEDAEKRAQTNKVEDQMRVVAELNDELSNVRIEKRLIEDRVKSEMKEIKEEQHRQLEKAKLGEVELRVEVQNLETKLEMLRSKSEEVSANNTSDAQAKLLRQIETLQSQYALASENWQGIENSLNGRITALEKERDELSKREADVRKKAREVNSKARKLEDDLEESNDRSGTLESEVSGLKTSLSKLQIQIDTATKEAHDARAELEREKKEFDMTMQTRMEEEKGKWRLELANQNYAPVAPGESPNNFLRTESPATSFSYRKASTPELGGSMRRSHTGNRAHAADISSLIPSHSGEHTRSSSKRSITQAQYFPTLVRTPTDPSLASRYDQPAFSPTQVISPTQMNGGTPPLISASTAPSIHTIDVDDRDDLTNRSSPQRTVAELISASTAGAGPSVQLVERMSATVRRLEMEKTATREEIARLQGQRDEARSEVVNLMRELEGVKDEQARVGGMEAEINELKQRYNAALEMIGEKSEECEELRNDVIDLKKIYRELVESTLN